MTICDGRRHPNDIIARLVVVIEPKICAYTEKKKYQEEKSFCVNRGP